MTKFWEGIFLVVASPVVGVFLGWACMLALVVMDRLVPDVLPGVSNATPQEIRNALLQIGGGIACVTTIAIFVKGIFTMFE